MSDQEKENRKPENGDMPSEQENREYRFMDQTIKKRPVNRKTQFLRVFGMVGAGVVIGLVASLVFSLTQTALSHRVVSGESNELELPADTEQSAETEQADPDEIPQDLPGSGEAVSGEALSGEEVYETVPDDDSDPEEQERITLRDYRQLFRDMMDVAEEPEQSLVQVIGITSEMDYFNRNYENQRRISGLAVAMTDTDLYILTEYRVVDKVERIQVVFCDGSMTDAVFQKADQNTGLAVIKVPLKNISEETREKLSIAPLGNSYVVERGEPVLAVGSPLGFTDSIAYGIVTSTGSKATVADTEYALMTTDIEGSADGSGVLINLDGKVVGIITASFGSNTGNITGLSISQVKELIEDLSNNTPQNYAGILGQDVTQDITDRTGIPRGLLVTGVEQDSPAMLAGIKEYDVIVRIGDKQVDTMRQYHTILQELEPEEEVLVTAMRRGAEGYAEITFDLLIESK